MNWCACGHRWCEARRMCKGAAERFVWDWDRPDRHVCVEASRPEGNAGVWCEPVTNLIRTYARDRIEFEYDMSGHEAAREFRRIQWR